jgi:transcriptional regulator NrdR family protein
MTAREDGPAKACPKCGGKLKTVDSRKPSTPGVLTRRRCLCPGCGARFTTHEIVVSDENMVNETMLLVAAADRATDAIRDTLLAGLDADTVKSIRLALANLRRFA